MTKYVHEWEMWLDEEKERERLIELLNNSLTGSVGLSSVLSTSIADYILANGVIVPPCKVGDTVYYVNRGRIERLEIRNINYSFRDREYYVYLENSSGKALNINYYQLIGYRLFNTLEEAEKALEAREKE